MMDYWLCWVPGCELVARPVGGRNAQGRGLCEEHHGRWFPHEDDRAGQECPGCGATFSAHRRNQRFCSTACHRKNRNTAPGGRRLSAGDVGFLYMIGTPTGRLAKVGYTNDPLRRLQELMQPQVVLPATVERDELELLHTIRTLRTAEASVHSELAAGRQGQSEWFAVEDPGGLPGVIERVEKAVAKVMEAEVAHARRVLAVWEEQSLGA